MMDEKRKSFIRPHGDDRDSWEDLPASQKWAVLLDLLGALDGLDDAVDRVRELEEAQEDDVQAAWMEATNAMRPGDRSGDLSISDLCRREARGRQKGLTSSNRRTYNGDGYGAQDRDLREV